MEWYQPATHYCGTYKAFDFSAVASQGQTKVGEQCVQGQEEKQDSQRDVQTLGGASMIEAIRTFFGRVRGQHREKETVVVEGRMWRCTKCKLIFVTKSAGEQHECSERV